MWNSHRQVRRHRRTSSIGLHLQPTGRNRDASFRCHPGCRERYANAERSSQSTVPRPRKTMLHWVLDAVQLAKIDRKIVVVGYRDDLVRAEVGGRSGVQFALQSSQQGTGHAVQQCIDLLRVGLAPEDATLIVAGDSPLIQSDSSQRSPDTFQTDRPRLPARDFVQRQPLLFGRIVRDSNGTLNASSKRRMPAQRKKRFVKST